MSGDDEMELLQQELGRFSHTIRLVWEALRRHGVRHDNKTSISEFVEQIGAQRDRLAELLREWEKRGLHEFTCPVFDRHRHNPVCVCMLGATRVALAAITAARGEG